MQTIRRFWPAGLPQPRLSRVAAGIVIVGSATAIGQGALVLAAPILARLYDPQAFGLLSVYSALLSVLVAGASLRFDMAVPLARDAREALHIVIFSVGLGIVSSLVITLGIFAWGSQIATALGVEPLIPFLWLLPFALFVASVAQALASWAVYLRDFAALGRLRATQGIGQAVCQVIFGIAGVSPAGLIVGDVVGRVAGVERLLVPFWTAIRAIPFSARAIARDARARWGFARVMTAASLLNALTLQVPFLLIPVLFDLDSSGQYFLAYKVLVLPASFVATAVSQVFFGEASFHRSNPERLRVLARSATVSLFIFAIPIYGVATVAGSALVTAVFGARWESAGMFAQIMAPWMVLWSVASPISPLLLVGRRERESLMFTAAELMLIATSLCIGAVVHSLIVGIVLLSVTSVFLSVGALWRFLRVASVTLGELATPVGRIALITLPLLVVLVLIASWPPLALVLISVVGSLTVIGLAAWATPELRTFLSSAHD